ncbi:MAG: hypothetical protein AN488_19885 [Anabaena sp. WA113]|jgi:hypothetical protein|nr:MAG: hypothetical protein AN488_19885 [Anabaena sp. WA113]
MFSKKLKITTTIEIQVEVEVEVQLNEDEHDPSDFGIDQHEHDFSIQDSEDFEEFLSEKADERAKKTASKRLSEAIKELEKNIKTNGLLYEGGHLESLDITYCHIENIDSDWEVIAEESAGYV